MSTKRRRVDDDAVIDPAAAAQVPALVAALAWARASGGMFDGLRLALDPHGGVGIYAARAFAAGDTLAFVPHACALTVGVVRAHAFGARVVEAARSYGALDELSDELLLCLAIAAGRSDASLPWHPLVAAFPDESPEPCCWPEGLRAELVGTPIGLAVSGVVARFALHVARLVRRLGADGVVPAAAAEERRLLWARGMYHSRGYTGRLASRAAAEAAAGLPAEGAADGVLLPIVDLMNHRHQQPITWQVEDSGVRFVAGAPLAKGEEVCTNYGCRPNEELLFSYGFVLREPAADAVSLLLAQRRGAPDGRGGDAQVVKRETHYVRAGAHGGIPASLLAALGEPAGGDGGGSDDAIAISDEALEVLLDTLAQKRSALRASAAGDKRAIKRMERAQGAQPEAGAREAVLRGAIGVYRSGQRRVLKEAIAAVRELLEAAVDGAAEEEEAE
jgi:hypothetical protein